MSNLFKNKIDEFIKKNELNKLEFSILDTTDIDQKNIPLRVHFYTGIKSLVTDEDIVINLYRIDDYFLLSYHDASLLGLNKFGLEESENIFEIERPFPFRDHMVKMIEGRDVNSQDIKDFLNSIIKVEKLHLLMKSNKNLPCNHSIWNTPELSEFYLKISNKLKKLSKKYGVDEDFLFRHFGENLSSETIIEDENQ